MAFIVGICLRVSPIHKNPSQITLHVPKGSVEACKNAPYWQDMNVVELEAE